MDFGLLLGQCKDTCYGVVVQIRNDFVLTEGSAGNRKFLVIPFGEGE